MNVVSTQLNVITMLHVVTLMVAITAPVILDSLEMDLTALVCSTLHFLQL